MNTTTCSVCRRSGWLPGAMAAVCLLLSAARPASAAHKWNGSVNGNIDNASNYSETTYSCYFNTDNLTGAKTTYVWLPKDLIGSVALAGESTKRYRGLCFQKGDTWQLHGKNSGNTIFTLDNSGGSDSSNDKDRIVIGCNWTGGNTSGDASLRMHCINIKTAAVIVGSNAASSPTKGTLVLDDLNNHENQYHGPVNLQITGGMQIYNGRVESTAADVTVSSLLNMGYSDNARAELAINSGTWKVQRLWMSRSDNTVAKLYMRGGLLQTTGSGDDGRFTVASTPSATSTNYVEVSGGTIDCSSGSAFRLGGPGTASSLSEMLVSGGMVKCREFRVGDSSTAKLEMTGGTIDVSAGYLYFSRYSGCAADMSCEMNLSGGTVVAKRIAYGSGSAPAVLRLDGGTLRAAADEQRFLAANSKLSVLVGSAGARFDTAGRSIAVAAPLLPDVGGDGGLSVTGGGVAAFRGGVNLSGAVSVGEDTSLRWFDQDGEVRSYSVAELNLGPGSTLFLGADASACDSIAAGETHVTATSAKPATVVIVSGEAVPDGTAYPVLDADDASLFEAFLFADGASVPCVKSIVGGRLVVTAASSGGDAPDLPSGVWTGVAGSLSMRDPMNWRNGALPLAGDVLDLTAMSSNATLSADIAGAPVYAGFETGGKVVTFSGEIAFKPGSDTSTIAVADNSTVIIDGDLLFEGSGSRCVAYRIGEGGAFVVNGSLGKAAGSECVLYPQSTALGEDTIGGGVIVADRIVNNGASDWVEYCVNKTSQKWIIGPGGIAGTSQEHGMWILSDIACSAEIQPNTNDFAVALRSCLRENIASFTINTTGWGDGLGHVVRLDAGYADSGDMLSIAGIGKVVCNHAPFEGTFGLYPTYSGAVEVLNGATLALNAGSRLTTGATVVSGGARLELPMSGTADSGQVVMNPGSTLAFNFTEGGAAPKLKLAGGLKGTVPLRICSFNVRCKTADDTGDKAWDNRKAAFVALIKEMDPDIIGFQEARNDQNSDLTSTLTDWTYLPGTVRDSTSASAYQEYVSLAFRKSRFTRKNGGTFWLSGTPDTKNSKYSDSNLPRICQWMLLTDKATGSDCLFASTHLDLSASVRDKQMRVIVENKLAQYIADGTPFILVGDMNCNEIETTIRRAKLKLNDAFFASRTVPAGPWRSYNGFTYMDPATEPSAASLRSLGVTARNSVKNNSRIDFVLTSKNIEVESFACRNDTQPGKQQYVSDHFPQLVDLAMPVRTPGDGFRVAVGRSGVKVAPDTRFVLTEGAGLASSDKLEFVLPPWVERAGVEDGEIVIYTRDSRGFRVTVR